MDTTDVTEKTPLSSASMDTTCQMIENSPKTGDTTSGKLTLLRNLANNICMAKYPY